MNSQARAPAARRIAVAASVAAAIAIPGAQAALHLGLSQAEFAAQGDTTVRAAAAAFSIWGLIYLGLAAYAVFQARARETPVLAAFGWPSAIAVAACAAWIIASALDLKSASVVIILIGAGAAISAVLKRPRPQDLTERLLVAAPNTLLAGWLTIASVLNIVTVATAFGLVGPGQADVWAAGAVAVLMAVAGAVAWRSRSAVYLLPIAWGLAWVFVAERPDRPLLSGLAAACAVLALAAAAWLAARGRASR